MKGFRSKKTKIALFLAISSLILSLLSSSTLMAKENETRHLFVISLDHVSLQELIEEPTFQKIIDMGSAGLLATRTGASLKVISRGSAYASISTGEKVSVMDEFAMSVFNEDEEVPEYGMEAGELYSQRVTKKLYGKVFSISFPALIKQLESQEATGLGKLAELLEKNGVLTIVLGNADDPVTTDRSFAISLIDRQGQVREGDVTKFLTDLDMSFPGGYVTDYDAIEDEIREIIAGAGDGKITFWIETGDTARLERYFEQMDISKYEELKKKSIKRAGEFVLKLLKQVDLEKDTVLIISAVPSVLRNEERTNLTAIIGVGNGFKKGAYLYSNTTRQPGLVTLIDIPPTILSLFGIEGTQFSGNRIISRGRFIKSEILTFDEKVKNVSSTRATALTVYVTLLIISIIAATMVVIFRNNGGLSEVFEPLFLTIATFPLSLLIISPLYRYHHILPPIAAAILSGVSSWAFKILRKHPFEKFIWIGSITALVVIFDAVVGAPLARFSPLGYNPVIGARFYGIGNEYMGVMVSGTLFIAFAIARWLSTRNIKRQIVEVGVVAVFILCVILLGSPVVGANVGGALSAAIAFLVAYIYWRREKLTWSDLGEAIAVLIVVLILLVLMSFFSPSFHLSKLVSQVREGYFEAIEAIVYRKAMVSIKLLKYTVWSNVLLTVIIAFPILMMRPPGLLAKILKNIKPFNAAIIGAALGSVAAFFLNDSGVVAAATMVIYPVLGLLCEILRSKEIPENL